MTPNPKRLVVELKSDRETACRITGTREGLQLLAQDLSRAVNDIPVQTAVTHIQLPGWEQYTFEAWQNGFYFRVEPDIEAYIQQRRASQGGYLPWIQGAFAVILISLALIGIRTVCLWIF